MSDKHIRATEPIEEQLSKAVNENTWLKGQNHQLKLTLDVRTKELAEAKAKADHFDILMGAVKDNELVKASWDKFMMALRLAGYDGTR